MAKRKCAVSGIVGVYWHLSWGSCESLDFSCWLWPSALSGFFHLLLATLLSSVWGLL